MGKNKNNTSGDTSGQAPSQRKPKTNEERQAIITKHVKKANLRLIAVTLGGLFTVGYKGFLIVTASTNSNSDVGTSPHQSATCSVDPNDWTHPFTSDEVNPLSTFDAVHNESLFWGHFRPSVYWGLRTRSWPTMGAVGMMWSTPLEKENLPPQSNGRKLSAKDRVLIRHDCREGDGVAPFGFDKHDGRGFASQHISDTNAGIHFHTIMAKPQLLSDIENEAGHPLDGLVANSQFEWVARVSGKPLVSDTSTTTTTIKSKPISLLFYVGYDCDGLVDSNQCIQLPKNNEGNKGVEGLEVAFTKHGGVVISPRSNLLPHHTTSGASSDVEGKLLHWELNFLPANGKSYSINPGSSSESTKEADPLSSPYYRYQCIDSSVPMSEVASYLSDHLAKVSLRPKKTFVKLEKEAFFNNSCGSLSSSSMVALVVTFSADEPFSIDMNMFNDKGITNSFDPINEKNTMSLEVDDQGNVLETTTSSSSSSSSTKSFNVNQWRSWMDRVFDVYERKFEERFESIWKLKAKGFGESHIKAGQFAMSNMLGGMGYFAGKLKLKSPKVTILKAEFKLLLLLLLNFDAQYK
jgi:hypothetical protein